MKTLTVFAVALLAAAAYAAKPISLPAEETTIFNYHRKIGIPAAKRIRLEEEQLAQNSPGRIVGGWTTYRGEHAFLGGLLIVLEGDPSPSATSVCGACLLSNYHLVTAAHCYYDGIDQASSVLVVVGSTTLFYGGTRITATHVQTHENFNPPSTNYDVAIIYTHRITYTNYVQSIALPAGTTAPSYAGYMVMASGYGRHDVYEEMEEYPQSRMVWLDVITNSQCQQAYGANVFASSLCTNGAGGIGICDGDSGGPLAYDNGEEKILIGIASWFSPYGCGVGHPSVFSRVTSYRAWIQRAMDDWSPESR